jgi:hypothetical protein
MQIWHGRLTLLGDDIQIQFYKYFALVLEKGNFIFLRQHRPRSGDFYYLMLVVSVGWVHIIVA